MRSHSVLTRISAAGLRVRVDGANLVVGPREAITDELRGLIKAHRAKWLAEIASNDPEMDPAEARKVKALAFLEDHANVKRACFADPQAMPGQIVLTVAVREPWGAVEVLVSKDRFDAFAIMDLANRYPATSLSVPEH